MRCVKCNQEIDEKTGKCNHCGENMSENIRVLTPEEKSHYNGVTIDTNANREDIREENINQQYYQEKPNQRVYVKNVNLNHSNWLAKVAIFLIIASIAAFMVFIALPIVLIGIGVGIVVWLVLSVFKG
ncbi:MAG: hypothetical protein K0Q53_2480 [Massilibacillus sp.]|jgi:hypothetical protein|nr:hypothetical protein [Massilibacillus sp.]